MLPDAASNSLASSLSISLVQFAEVATVIVTPSCLIGVLVDSLSVAGAFVEVEGEAFEFAPLDPQPANKLTNATDAMMPLVHLFFFTFIITNDASF
ncbi:hypothetical protein [Paenibacillus sp.]|uniref:hypothetical protein n=1 Tax=Paenibacillus sp. TaxID=58172 RepID=UPI0028AAEEAC|nr:hypothetical protein [Paenibacillus sp.]